MKVAPLALIAVALCSCEGRVIGGPLHKLVEKNDAEGIKALVAKGEVDINEKGGGGQSPLMLATLSGKTESVQALLDMGADPEVPEKDGYTPIHGSGFQGRPEIAQILIKHGVDPMSKHKDGYFPIHRALWGTEMRHTRTVQTFLEAGVPFDLTLLDGRTLLDVVNKRTNPKTHQLLMNYKEKQELEQKQKASNHDDEL
eukprot:TRINITY_DN37732_c0_g1_i1.p1 TRINITY_DN37732_c0_g1~~TRINITY_DN37732_c0_g1_i1.p1  ORF type:complete len:217 (+),score=46.11 TRINITY_DN37732_c0_g1_i1:55-651(+)